MTIHSEIQHESLCEWWRLPLRRAVGVWDLRILVGTVCVDVLCATRVPFSPSSHFGRVSCGVGGAARCGLDVFKNARRLCALCERSVLG